MIKFDNDNKMQVWAILDEFLHSDLASRPDNYRKRKVVLSLPPEPVSGVVEYCIHWQRELRRNWQSLWVLLTGTDVHCKPVEGLEPSHWWKQIIELTRSPKRPHGIKGSPKLLSRRACPCLAGACISQCSCPHCTTFLENLDHRHLAVQCGWRRRKAGDGECLECGGNCHDRNGAWLQMSNGVQSFAKSVLCPPVAVKGLFLAAVDPRTGLEIPGQQIPIKMIRRRCWLGNCPDCGWDNRFASFPSLPVILREDGDTEREVFVRACPLEARSDVNTTYHQFQKMERGTGTDGKPYTQPEWCPVVSSRRVFYYRLYEFMKDFLPHYYTVLWHQACEQVFVQHYKRLAFFGMPNQPQPPDSMKGWYACYMMRMNDASTTTNVHLN